MRLGVLPAGLCGCGCAATGLGGAYGDWGGCGAEGGLGAARGTREMDVAPRGVRAGPCGEERACVAEAEALDADGLGGLELVEGLLEVQAEAVASEPGDL